MINIVQASDHLESASSLRELISVYTRFLDNIGEFHYALGRFDRFRKRPHDIIHVSYPQEWVALYTERKYISDDPTILRSSHTEMPYLWHEIDDLRPTQRAIFAGLSDFGIRDGYTIPIHSPDGMVFVASFALRQTALSSVERLAITTLTTQFYFRYRGLSVPAPPTRIRLSGREAECLRWAARGKSSWETGMILGISESTVNFHVKNALVKLRCNNRIVGVVRAICLGLISP
ncbi:LuxR family transcriptional regulator [Gluconacetobacter sacchari]|uniref:LuxR family transcriptional regulator n=2 Tax=Gluconacetobacter sacchari TaxID=92759 RepID=A0A7W4IGL8_9PROT|nr:LuxR family transcriptional regulator [Gluconacetobacter sacchari]MBB2162558.1 LuxR family transcriptional regulator [Gluconacetobacter sacchari]GBQ31150.1 LuxR family transcriptional regulator [Gluconacetobacter sacchari DSM 12717]